MHKTALYRSEGMPRAPAASEQLARVRINRDVDNDGASGSGHWQIAYSPAPPLYYRARKDVRGRGKRNNGRKKHTGALSRMGPGLGSDIKSTSAGRAPVSEYEYSVAFCVDIPKPVYSTTASK